MNRRHLVRIDRVVLKGAGAGLDGVRLRILAGAAIARQLDSAGTPVPNGTGPVDRISVSLNAADGSGGENRMADLIGLGVARALGQARGGAEASHG